MYRIAMLSMHGCPVSRLGEKDTGGMNVYVLQIARELGERGHSVDVYTRVHNPDDPQIVGLGDNARVIHLQAGPYHKTKESLHQYIPKYLRRLEEFREAEGLTYDLVHSHYWLSGQAGLSLADSWQVPHVTTFHTLARKKLQARAGESEPERRVQAETRVIEQASAIVVSTDQEKEDLSRLYGVSPRSVRIIPAGVDLDLFKPVDREDARRSLGIQESNVLLSVGRIEPLKGLEILVRAMALLSDLEDSRLVIVGGKPQEDDEIKRLKSIAAELGVETRTSFTGTVQQTELPAYYSAADVFVLPSYYESFGLVALEAMACGTPVIASRVGGPGSFITSGETGYLVPWPCPEPYAQRLDVLLANPALAAAMGKAARAKALTMGWDMAARRIVNLYTTLIRSPWTKAAGA
jgi:D-inositol-3-phosphate glycosyltransferase